jgi:hypothetical protein
MKAADFILKLYMGNLRAIKEQQYGAHKIL